MDRDKPPFGPSGDSMDPPGNDDSWSDRDLTDRARRATSEREIADRYRFARGEQGNPPAADDYGDAGNEPQRRSFERMGRFSRDDMDNDSGVHSTPSSRMLEPHRTSDADHSPAPKRPAFLGNSHHDAPRSEQRRPSFLDRSNDDTAANTMRPSFLDRPAMDEAGFDGEDYNERPQPVRRSFRGMLPRQNAGDPGAGPAPRGGDDPADWPMASDGRPEFGDNAGGYDRPDPRDNRYEREPPSQASKDWRTSRFASRFAQPPKAYDLDEVADQEISFDPDTNSEPVFETRREAVPQFSEEDLVQKARARSRGRFGSSREPEGVSEPADTNRYNQFDEPPWEPEAPVPDRIDDGRAYQATYEEDAGRQADTYLPSSSDKAEFDTSNPAGDRYETEAAPEAVDDFDYEPEDDYQDYMPQDETGGSGPGEQPFPANNEPPARSADVYTMQAPSMHKQTTQGYNAPPGQAYGDPSLDPYEMELDQGQHDYDDYDDYDAGGRHPVRGSSMDPDDLRGERAGGQDDGYAPYAGTFQDFDEKEGRRPVVLIGALVGVAFVAGGLIFAYQMFSSGENSQVPVVKLGEAPSKVAPNDPGGLDIPHQNKLIYDRIAGEETAVAEKVVSREEKVIELETEKAESDSADASGDGASAVIPPAPDEAVPENQEVADTGLEEATAILESGDGSDDESLEEAVEAEAAPAAAEPPLPSAPEESIPLRVETVDPPAGSETEVARAAPPIPVSKPSTPSTPAAPAAPEVSEEAANDASGGGPIQIARIPQVDDRIPQSEDRIPQGDDASSDSNESLEPEASAPEALAGESDASEPAAEPAGEGGFMIQIAAFRTEPEAQKEFRRLQGKHSGLLESYGPAIQKADLGSRGIYYRLRVGPIASKEAASSLCSSLISAGEKDCLVRNK